jgi:transcriptional repressor NrdR
MLKSAEKTTVTAEQVEHIVNEIESSVTQRENAEIESQAIGDMIAVRLKNIDKVAYIRFSSVFRRFVDVEEFEKELKKLL